MTSEAAYLIRLCADSFAAQLKTMRVQNRLAMAVLPEEVAGSIRGPVITATTDMEHIVDVLQTAARKAEAKANA